MYATTKLDNIKFAILQINESKVWKRMHGLPQNECKYNKKDWRLKEQFSNDVSSNEMMIEIIWELTADKKMSEMTSEQILVLARMLKAQRAQKCLWRL